jgi:hypothetical protein
MITTQQAPMVKYSNHVQKGQEVNKVYKTNDLSIFKQIDGNRVPNLQHIKRLTDSIRVYGMKCNPILVNERMEVIDGQHRLMAAKEAKSFVYYIIVDGYTLDEVHTLNLNQKNWTKKDFMEGYADMGISSYVKLKKFVEKNEDYSFSDCIALCSQLPSASRNYGITQKYRADGREVNLKEVFEEGTWLGKDFDLGQEWANKIRMVKPYYVGYNRSNFVGCMISLLQNENFDFNEFMHKLRIQPTALVDCANREQYRTLIEDIYNYRSRSKVNLRY